MSETTSPLTRLWDTLTDDLARLPAHLTRRRGDLRTLVEQPDGTFAREGEADPLVLSEGEPPRLRWSRPEQAEGWRGARVHVVLAAHRGMVLDQSLPLAAKPYLGDIIGNQIGNWVPWPREDIVLGHALAGEDTAQVHLRIAALPRTALAPITALLQEAAARTLTFSLLGEGEDAPPVPLDHDEATGPDTAGKARHRAGQAVLSVVAAILALVAATFWLGSGLGEREAAARAELATLARARSGASDPAMTLTRRKTDGPLMMALLDEVARVLPDDTWLTGLEANGNRVQIDGSATQAADLIARLSASPLFEAPQFVAPTTREGPSGRETFHIRFTLKSRGQEP